MLPSTVPLSPAREAASGRGTWGWTIPPTCRWCLRAAPSSRKGEVEGIPPGTRTRRWRSLPSALLPARRAKPTGGARCRHQLLQPARRRQLRRFAGCWQGNLLEWMGNVRVTYRNSHAVCLSTHTHAWEGRRSGRQTNRQSNPRNPILLQKQGLERRGGVADETYLELVVLFRAQGQDALDWIHVVR